MRMMASITITSGTVTSGVRCEVCVVCEVCVCEV